jgi:hypothetical protein
VPLNTPAAPAPPEIEASKPAPPRPARRARSAGQGRIVRGLSINPFDEAASRLER